MEWITLTSSRLLGNGGFLRPIEYFHFTAKIDWDNDQSVADFRRRNLANGPNEGVNSLPGQAHPIHHNPFFTGGREKMNERLKHRETGETRDKILRKKHANGIIATWFDRAVKITIQRPRSHF